MKLQGSANQASPAYLYRADVTLGSGASLVLGRSMSRTALFLQNIGAHNMNVEVGAGAAHAVLTSGVVTSVAVDNAGFNFTKPPLVRFLGGGQPAVGNGAPGQTGGLNTSYVGLAQANAPTPSNVAQAHAVLATGAISSITVDNGGSGYQVAPYVQLINGDLDPNGASLPSSTSGFLLAAGAILRFDNTVCPTEPISVIGTSGDVLLCRWTE